jgi:hypothetical protein
MSFHRFLVLDFCFANIICGKHGHCVNTLSGFKCSCSFLYGGLLCERSKNFFFQGKIMTNQTCLNVNEYETVGDQNIKFRHAIS